MSATIADLSESAARQQRKNNRQLLKRLTRLKHERAELRWTQIGAFHDIDAYRMFLRTMLDIHDRFGGPATRVVPMEHHVWERERASALRIDLQIKPAMSDPHSSAPMEKDFAWGVLYVLNGSAMGAAMLLNSNAINADWPTAYLEVMCEFARSGALGAFFRSLNDAEVQLGQVARGAEAVFDAVVGMDVSTRA